MIDTHIHLYDPAFDDDRAEVVLRARSAGVRAMILASVSEKEYEPMLAVEREYENYCYATIGLQPEELTDLDGQMRWVEQGLKSRPWIAIGEVGLDYHYNNDPITDEPLSPSLIEKKHREQQQAFRQQIEWALEYDVPLLIHSRDAYQDTLQILQEHRSSRLRGVMHCFSGSAEWAREIMKTGDFYFGIGGVVTFKNAKLPEQIVRIGLDRLVLETDAPYLAPTPRRGQRNESAYMTLVAEKIALCFGISSEQVEKQTDINAANLLGEKIREKIDI